MAPTGKDSMPDETAIASVHRLIGNEGLKCLVAAFFRQVPGDEILSAIYPADDLDGAEQRLLSFLIFRFGGPDHYLQQRGHPQLRMRHAPFTITQGVRDRWMLLMERALIMAELPAEATAIMQPFLSEVATFLINRGFGAVPTIIS